MHDGKIINKQLLVDEQNTEDENEKSNGLVAMTQVKISDVTVNTCGNIDPNQQHREYTLLLHGEKNNINCDGDQNIYDNNGNIAIKKKKKADFGVDLKPLDVNQENIHFRPKPKRDPLPMKLRALPQSFWQQPNNTPSQSPGTVCPALSLPCKDVEDSVNSDSPSTTISEANSVQHEEVVSDANTDLLFSLFRVVEEEQRSLGQSKITLVRRGRPRKTVASATAAVASRGALKDDDPCLASTVSEALLPLLHERGTRGKSGAAADNRAGSAAPVCTQTLSTVPLSVDGTSAVLTAAPTDHNYTRLLSEVVIRL